MSKFKQPIEAGRAIFASVLRLSAKALAAAGLLSVVLLAPTAQAAATITGVKAAQRYPWNGKVDITYTVSGLAKAANDEGMTPFITVLAIDRTTMPWMTNTAEMACLFEGPYATNQLSDVAATSDGTHQIVWDLDAQKLTLTSTNVVFAVLGDGGVQPWKDGPYWATCNVGATKPEEYGYYFWWGDTVGYKRNASKDGWVSVKDGTDFSFGVRNCRTYGLDNFELQSAGYVDAMGNLVATNDAATAHLGAPWRMPTDAETFCTGVSAPVRVDSRTGQVREAASVETLTYNANYVNGAAVGASVDITVNGSVQWQGLTGVGAVEWSPSVLGTNFLMHCVKDAGGGEVTNLTARFLVPYAEVETNGLDLAGVAVQVLDAEGKPLVAATEGELAGKLVVASNGQVRIVWTVTQPGVYFADGTTERTQSFTADKIVQAASSSVTKPEAPQAPTFNLGVVAQRYPWNGMVDVNYKATFWPAGKQAAIEVTVGESVTTNDLAVVGQGEVVGTAAVAMPAETNGKAKFTGVYPFFDGKSASHPDK